MKHIARPTEKFPPPAGRCNRGRGRSRKHPWRGRRLSNGVAAAAAPSLTFTAEAGTNPPPVAVPQHHGHSSHVGRRTASRSGHRRCGPLRLGSRSRGCACRSSIRDPGQGVHHQLPDPVSVLHDLLLHGRAPGDRRRALHDPRAPPHPATGPRVLPKGGGALRDPGTPAPRRASGFTPG